MPLLTFDETLDHLRGRVMRCRGSRTWQGVAKAMGVTPATMQRFLRGDDPSAIVLRKLVAWCDAEEACPTKNGPSVPHPNGAPVVTPQPEKGPTHGTA